MKARINKIINWQGKEYAHVIEDEPSQFCDLCAFNKLCWKVVSNELSFNNSPMKVCNDLCDKENTHFAMFVEASEAQDYIKKRNDHI